jgi:hypothetical protein
MAEDKKTPDMDPADLYKEEVFTDRKIGTIRRLTPVDGQGENDTSRPVTYVGEAQLMSSAGPIPLHFEIPATSLEDAAKKFSDEAEKAIERTMRQLEEMRREAASGLVLPGQGGGGGMGGPGGGMGGPGGIQLP